MFQITRFQPVSPRGAQVSRASRRPAAANTKASSTWRMASAGEAEAWAHKARRSCTKIKSSLSQGPGSYPGSHKLRAIWGGFKSWEPGASSYMGWLPCSFDELVLKQPKTVRGLLRYKMGVLLLLSVGGPCWSVLKGEPKGNRVRGKIVWFLL